MKMKILMQLKIVAVLFLMLSSSAYAGKYDLLAGFYSYSATVSEKTSALSGIGTYEAAYMLPVSNHFEFNFGYSMTMTGVIGGDLSYGPKIGFNYYPFNFASNEKIVLGSAVVEIHDFLKPYVGLSFNQRQFQSARTSYAGMAISLGAEKYINKDITLKTELKMNSLSGAADAKASILNLLVGLVFEF